jgi:hypothetical protein
MNVQEFLQLFGANVVDFFSRLIPEYVFPNLQLIIEVIVLFVLAYVIGKIGKAITTRLLIVVGLKRITIRSWTDDILKAVGYRGTIVGLIGDLVKWFIYIIFLGVIIQTLGFPGLVNTFNQIAIFVPRFIVAILIIVIGFLIADFLGKIFEEAARRLFVDESLGMLSGAFIKYAVALISVIMALSLIGLDTLSITVLFSIILIGTIGIFVLGIRDLLPNYTAGVYIKRELRHGEHIKIGQYSGIVERIDPTFVVLKNGNKRITIPSSFFVKNPVEKTRLRHRNK